MKFPLAEIRKNAVHSIFTFENEVDVSEVKELHEDIRAISPVQVKGECFVDVDRYIFSFTITGEMILPCARTLVDVPYPFRLKEVEIYAHETGDADEIDEIIFPIEGEVIDLMPSIRENILLNVPYRVFTDDEEALSNVLSKGKGWALTLEEDEQDDKNQGDRIDPRLMKLQSFLDNKKDQ